MRLLSNLLETWHWWRAKCHSRRYRYHAERALVLRERRAA